MKNIWTWRAYYQLADYFNHTDWENKNRTFLGEEISYYNFDLEREYYERVQKGLQLFAKHFLSLWD